MNNDVLLEIGNAVCRSLAYGNGRKIIGIVKKVTPKYAWTDTGLKIQRFPDGYAEYKIVGGGDYKKCAIATPEIVSAILKAEIRAGKESSLRGWAIHLLSADRIRSMSDNELDNYVAFIIAQREEGIKNGVSL